MPLLTSVIRVTLNGVLGQGEVFSTGFWVQGTLPTTQAAADAASVTYAADISTALSGLCGFLSPDASYTNVKTYWYGSPGTPAAFITNTALTGKVGIGGRSVPYQTCMVASLRTSSLTRSGRGRMYLPANGVSLANNQFTSADCTAATSYVGAILRKAQTDLLTSSPNVVISSTKDAVTRPVNKIIVDSRPDVQRRRAQKETVLFTSTVAFP